MQENKDHDLQKNECRDMMSRQASLLVELRIDDRDCKTFKIWSKTYYNRNCKTKPYKAAVETIIVPVG